VFTKICKYQITDFKFKKRDLNRSQRTLIIDAKDCAASGPYSSYLGKLKISNGRNNKFNWTDVKKEIKIVYSKYESIFYLHAPILVERKNIEVPKEKVVSLDPGENKFVTGYSLTGCFYIGTAIRKRIRRRLKKIDELKSKMKARKKRKWKYKRAIYRHYKKIKNDRDELHHKLNLYLVKTYERIMIPNFSSKKVSSRKYNLNPLTKRVLGQLSHYRMRERLQEKCKEYSSQYIEVDESYTTQTCGVCGTLNKEVNTNKERIYQCKKCGLEVDRDLNGARNILIKNRKKIIRKHSQKK